MFNNVLQAFRRRNIATFRNLAQQHLKRSSVNEQSDNQVNISYVNK